MQNYCSRFQNVFIQNELNGVFLGAQNTFKCVNIVHIIKIKLNPAMRCLKTALYIAAMEVFFASTRW